MPLPHSCTRFSPPRLDPTTGPRRHHAPLLRPPLPPVVLPLPTTRCAPLRPRLAALSCSARRSTTLSSRQAGQPRVGGRPAYDSRHGPRRRMASSHPSPPCPSSRPAGGATEVAEENHDTQKGPSRSRSRPLHLADPPYSGVGLQGHGVRGLGGARRHARPHGACLRAGDGAAVRGAHRCRSVGAREMGQ
jgi:hypothetical protein